MARQDILHYSANNGVPEMRAFPVTAGQSFQQGEPVVVVAAGTLSECADDPPSVDGIAAHRSTDVDGTDLGVGTPITVYGIAPGQTFKTKNFATDGAGTTTAPALTNVGDLAGFDLSGGNWFLDTGQNNLITQIVGVRDAAGNDLGNPNVLPGAGVWVLFQFI